MSSSSTEEESRKRVIENMRETGDGRIRDEDIKNDELLSLSPRKEKENNKTHMSKQTQYWERTTQKNIILHGVKFNTSEI